MKPVEDWLRSNLKNLEHPVFKDVLEIFEDELKPTGDGQIVIISDINRVKLSLETSDKMIKTLTAISKFEPMTSAGQQLAQECDVFDNEIMMYSDVLKSMENILCEVDDKNFLWPECYYCSDKKLLLQDLCELGYRVVPTHKFLDLDHTLLTMKALGKFHALSLVMKERNLLDLSKIRPNFYSKKVPFLINMHKASAAGIAQWIKQNWEPEWSKVADRLMKFVEDPGEAMVQMTESVKGKMDVLLHGDFSIRNMLFHYPPDSDKPDGIKFVDFQMCSNNNIGFDLASLLFTSVLPRLRESEMDTILEAYVESVTSICNRHGYKGRIPSTKDAADALRSLSYLTTLCSLSSYPFFIASGQMNLQEKVDEGMEKFNSENIEDLSSSNQTEELNLYYNNEQVQDILKFELDRCVKQNIL